MKTGRFYLLLSVLIFSSQTFAGLVLDPYVGMSSTNQALKFNDVTGFDEKSSSTATAMGSRFGWSFILLSAGIDYQMLSGKDADKQTTKITNTSAFVGVTLPLIRFWGEYFLSSKFDSSTATDYDFSFKDGYGVGVGTTILPLVSLNLEIETLNYDFDSGTYKGTYSFANTVFSVSFPIDL